MRLLSIVRTQDFKRSQPHPCEYTEGGIRDQFNLITSFVDASQVYGSENSVAISLREHRDGLMKNGGKVEGDELLPREPGKDWKQTIKSYQYVYTR